MQVSVIMPVFNAQEYLKESIQCVLDQSFQDFEFIICNDGSTDKSRDIICSFQDRRIRLLDSTENRGLVYQLNYALSEAKGKYIARFDADDYCTPDRLDKQISFLEKNPDYGLCGSWMQIMDTDRICKYPTSHQEIVDLMLDGNPIAHPVTVFRKEVLDNHGLKYEHEYWPAEDYKLWGSMMLYTKLYNIPETLLYYRQHPGQISQRKADFQKYKNAEAQVFLFKSLVPEFTADDLTLLHKILLWNLEYSKSNLLHAKRLFEALLDANNSRKVYSRALFIAKFAGIWYLLCKNSLPYLGLEGIKIYQSGQGYLKDFAGVLKLLLFYGKSKISKY